METPYYLYNKKILQKTLSEALKASSKYGFHIHYALKANANSEIVKIISDYGIGADCVNANEIRFALDHHIPADKVVFAGVGKTEKDIQFAIEADIFQINVESWGELELIDKISFKLDKVSNIALRISPDIKANSHSKISTGQAIHKFGFYMEDIPNIIQNIRTFKNVKLSGLHFHIGSQILDLEVFKDLAIKASNINRLFLDMGFNITNLNLGGGLGVDYNQPEAIPNFEQYFNLFNEYLFKDKNQDVHFELGRSLVANSGSLITKVLYIKKNNLKNFIIVDAGMNDLLRPALYNAQHIIKNISSYEEGSETYDIVGPICETSDTFAESVEINISRPGDLLKIFSTGAYGEVMASNYNLREKPKFVLI